MEKYILQMEHITKTFPGVKALDDVTFQVKKGEIHALVGENGAGKSTLMKVLSGIYTANTYTGKIIFENEEQKFNSIKDSEKKGIAIIYQELALCRNMNVAESIFLGQEIKNKAGVIDWNETYHKCKEYLKKVNLDLSPETKIINLGVGQQQRVALARIFLSEPDILMLDEPFSALDEYLRWNLEQELLEVLRQFSGPALFVSHSRDEIYRICGKVCVMDQGTSSPVISVGQLFEAPESKAAAVLSGCKNFARAQLAEADVKKTVYVRDWGEYLTCTGTKAGEIYYVGVRSHYIYPVSETEAKTHPDNTFRCRIEKVIDDVFSTVIMVMPEHAEQSEESCRNHFNRIRVETTKEFWRTFCEKEHPQESLWLHVDPADVMVLR